MRQFSVVRVETYMDVEFKDNHFHTPHKLEVHTLLPLQSNAIEQPPLQKFVGFYTLTEQMHGPNGEVLGQRNITKSFVFPETITTPFEAFKVYDEVGKAAAQAEITTLQKPKLITGPKLFV